jgi:hypothetical protein
MELQCKWKEEGKTESSQDKTRQDKTRQDKTRQDKTRHDTTRQDKVSTLTLTLSSLPGCEPSHRRSDHPNRDLCSHVALQKKPRKVRLPFFVSYFSYFSYFSFFFLFTHVLCRFFFLFSSWTCRQGSDSDTWWGLTRDPGQ